MAGTIVIDMQREPARSKRRMGVPPGYDCSARNYREKNRSARAVSLLKCAGAERLAHVGRTVESGDRTACAAPRRARAAPPIDLPPLSLLRVFRRPAARPALHHHPAAGRRSGQAARGRRASRARRAVPHCSRARRPTATCGASSPSSAAGIRRPGWHWPSLLFPGRVGVLSQALADRSLVRAAAGRGRARLRCDRAALRAGRFRVDRLRDPRRVDPARCPAGAPRGLAPVQPLPLSRRARRARRARRDRRRAAIVAARAHLCGRGLLARRRRADRHDRRSSSRRCTGLRRPRRARASGAGHRRGARARGRDRGRDGRATGSSPARPIIPACARTPAPP